MSEHGTVAILGAGSIGVAFAVRFATGGRRVKVWDPDAQALETARARVASQVAELARHGLVDSAGAGAADLVTPAPTIASAVEGVAMVIECAPEVLSIKQDLLSAAAAATSQDTVLASAASAIPPSALAGEAPFADRVLVAHPANPPSVLPLVELVPSPQTSRGTVRRADELFRGVGMRPIELAKEVEGFVFNRLQGAVLREAYSLVGDGVASVEQIDEVVRSALGRRWSVVGPFETADLNTRGGIEAHAEKLGPAYARMGAQRGESDAWTPSLVARVAAERRAVLPLDRWEEAVRWRDEQMLRLAPAWAAVDAQRASFAESSAGQDSDDT